MRFDYLSKIPFSAALEREAAAFARVRDSEIGGEVFGFETGPVITLGVRGNDEDLLWSAEEIAARGFEVRKLERGGQATLHNPGQLVIFPVVRIRDIGARAWVDLLLSVTRETLGDYGREVRCRAGKPGLYSDLGKMAAIGIRVREGISTHGLSINVANELGDFGGIRPCGEAAAPVDRVGTGVPLAELFWAWSKKFQNALPLGLTSSRNFTNLECYSDVRL